MKRWNVTALSMGAILALSGCGGGSSSTGSSSDVQTGKGYYKDKAVKGIDYICGNQKSKTGDNGVFTFEKGKECKFTLAGIPLKTIKADELVDGKEFPENNRTVALFIQSIDADGNPDNDNDIEITEEVLAALTKALETTQSQGKLPEGTVLTEVVAFVGHDVEGVSGEVRTDAQVESHLAQTQTEIAKALVAGKTFYSVGQENGELVINKLVFNKEATSIKIYKLDGTVDVDSTINIVGNKLTFTNDTDGSYTLISQKNGYIFGDDRLSNGTKDGTGHRVYTSQSDAQAYFDSVKPQTTTPTTTAETKALLAGKTFYYVQNDDFGHKEQAGFNLAKIELNTDDTLVWTEIDTIDANKPHNSTYHINGNHLFLFDNEEGSGEYIFVKQTNDYIEFDELSENNNPAYFFSDEQKAKNFKNKMNSQHEGNNNSLSEASLKAYFSGKTLYNINDKGAIETVLFNSDATTLQFGSEQPLSITISDGKMVNDEGDHFIDEITNSYVKGHDINGEYIFYVSRADAQTALDAQGNGGTVTNKNYTVYGGNTYFSGGFSSMPSSYVLLGKSNVTSTFTGTYKYYVIANENNNYTTYIDALKGSNNKYYPTNTTSNTGDTWQNLTGVPDNKYVSIGAHGYILIDAQSATLNEIKVFVK